jgi:hypothetical protein
MMRALNATDTEDGCVFELIPTLANTSLCRYIKDLVHLHVDLAALQTAEDKGKEFPQWSKYS